MKRFESRSSNKNCYPISVFRDFKKNQLLILLHILLSIAIILFSLFVSDWAQCSGVAMGEMGGSGPHKFLGEWIDQNPRNVRPFFEISAFKTDWKCFCWKRRGCTMYIYCDFLLLTSRRKLVWTPQLFWAGDATEWFLFWERYLMAEYIKQIHACAIRLKIRKPYPEVSSNNKTIIRFLFRRVYYLQCRPRSTEQQRVGSHSYIS